MSVAEYALKSVKLAGITSVAVRGDDSVCVITQRSRAPVVRVRARARWPVPVIGER
jgi:20S proteasome alpha/beta subunit